MKKNFRILAVLAIAGAVVLSTASAMAQPGPGGYYGPRHHHHEGISRGRMNTITAIGATLGVLDIASRVLAPPVVVNQPVYPVPAYGTTTTTTYYPATPYYTAPSTTVYYGSPAYYSAPAYVAPYRYVPPRWDYRPAPPPRWNYRPAPPPPPRGGYRGMPGGPPPGGHAPGHGHGHGGPRGHWR